ncbi:MAG: hypothetical protein K8S97_14515, partial [Anaerolineae bacterium]|nr:hypothetical protein [Anaerolineae bacterium]
PIDVGNNRQYRPPMPIDYGMFEWRVRSVDKAGNVSGWSSLWTFTVVAGVTAPELPTGEPVVAEPVVPTPEPAALVRGGKWVEAESAAVTREGTWTTAASGMASNGEYAMSSGQADILSLRFQGVRVGIVYVQNAALGSFVIEVDGEIVQIVDASLMRGTEFTQIITLDLPMGVHTVRIIGEAGMVAVDAFVLEDHAVIPGVDPGEPHIPPPMDLPN